MSPMPAPDPDGGMPAPRILVVQNDWDKPLGRVGDGLAAAGAALDVRLAEDELPHASGYDGLVVLPGLANPDDDDAAVDRARRSIELGLDAGVPVLGICLGGQLLAQALGGTTYRCRDERGYHEIAATPAARRDPLLREAPARFTAFHAHAYAFRPPRGAEVLLENEVCVQASRLGEAWALQFHPEVGPEWVDALARGVRGSPDRIDPRTAAFFRAGGIDPAELESGARRAAPTARKIAAGIAAGFAERCRASSARGAATPCEAGGR